MEDYNVGARNTETERIGGTRNINRLTLLYHC